MSASFSDLRSAAIALLSSETPLTRRAGSFLGQCVVDPTPLSDAQKEWMRVLLERAGLPQLTSETSDV